VGCSLRQFPRAPLHRVCHSLTVALPVLTGKHEVAASGNPRPGASAGRRADYRPGNRLGPEPPVRPDLRAAPVVLSMDPSEAGRLVFVLQGPAYLDPRQLARLALRAVPSAGPGLAGPPGTADVSGAGAPPSRTRKPDRSSLSVDIRSLEGCRLATA
jgi:hypothetical protein